MTASLAALARAEFKSSLGALSRAAGTANGTSLDLQLYEGPVLLVLDSAASAATGTLDLKLQDSADNSTFADVTVGNVVGGAFTQVTSAGASVQSRYIDKNLVNRYVRLVGTGVNAATVYSAGFIVQKKQS